MGITCKIQCPPRLINPINSSPRYRGNDCILKYKTLLMLKGARASCFNACNQMNAKHNSSPLTSEREMHLPHTEVLIIF